jgi:hypothetical protein
MQVVARMMLKLFRRCSHRAIGEQGRLFDKSVIFLPGGRSSAQDIACMILSTKSYRRFLVWKSSNSCLSHGHPSCGLVALRHSIREPRNPILLLVSFLPYY